MNSRRWPQLRISALRHLPAGMPGKVRLARALLHGIQSSEDVIVESVTGALFAVPHPAEPIGFHLLVDGQYEPETADFIVSRLSAGDVFIDVGANIGVFTVSAARLVGALGRVIAVEPAPVIFSYLKRNIGMNQAENVTALQVALSDQNRDHVPFYAAPLDHFGMGALAPQFHAQPCTVLTRTLDSVVEQTKLGSIALLKVDVEGHEYAVFWGARKLLSSWPSPAVVFEFSDWAEQRFPNGYAGQAQEFLMHLGYRIWRLSDYRVGGPPLGVPLRSGSAMLVAVRNH